MKRNDWEFAYPVTDILERAKVHEDYHREHLRHWQSEYDKLAKEMRDSAKVEEQEITGGVNQVLRYDPGLQKKVDEARNRRMTHETLAKNYGLWVMVLERTVQRLGLEQARLKFLMLDFEDIDFFFSEPK